jgi:hypothetical protein
MLSNYNFNLNPYYDDFDKTKNYYRILFKPGFAVQARELTQLQTQLQNQISNFGDHIFREGSVVLGGNFYYSNINYIDVSRNNSILNFDEQFFIGQSSEAKAKVILTKAITEDVARIYFSYVNGFIFQQNETIVCDNLNTENIINNENFSGTATLFSIDESVFYIYGNFVYCEPQTIVLSENTSATCRVGLFAEETITTSNQDTSLLDPALGSYNYSAPGADRYTISLNLVSFAYDPSNDSVEENASNQFIELSRFVDGAQVTINKLPIYSEIENTLARRTFDESGDYTVKSFGLKVRDHVYGNTSLLSLQIEPGKAYVKGYEFETIAPTYLDLPKSRTTAFENEFPIFVNYGKYFYVQNIVGGNLDYTNNPVVTLKNSSSDIIGNCIVKYVEFNSTVSGNNVYKLYVDSVNIFDSSNVSVSDISTFNTTTFQANIASSLYSNLPSLEGNDNSAYIVKIPKDYVSSVDSTETSYQTLIKVPSNAFFIQSGSQTIAPLDNSGPSNQVFLGTGVLSESDTRNLYLVTVTATTNSAAVSVGTILDYTTHGLRIDVKDEDSIEMTTNIANSFTATVFAKVGISGAIRKTKTLTNGEITISGASLTSQNLSGTISLQKSDCIELSSVIAVTNTSIEYEYTNNYEFNTGQTDTLYDHGFIRLKPGYSDPIKDNVGTITSVIIKFKYYEHSGLNSGFFNVGSYPTYDEIPNYTSSTGEVFDLKNCFDFRPRRTDNSTTITGSLLAQPSSIIVTDFEHYIGRIDKLVLTKERRFALIQGIPSITPSVPVDLPDSMPLYIITVPPYTNNVDEVSFTFIENRRYTMRDIGRIVKRVERMEYYTALSLLEKQAKDESIPSDIPTIDRFKNGILVDSFAGHSVGDVSNFDYRCAIDYNKRILRPSFSSDAYTFKLNSGTNFRKSKDLLTLNYTTETFINQPLASRFVNLNPYLVFTWNGFVELDPPSDNWVDTVVKPDVVVNLNGENDIYTVLVDNVEDPVTSGVRWSDWETVVNGTPQTTNQLSTSTKVSQKGFIETTSTTTFNTSTTTVTDQLARAGIEITTGEVQTITRDLGTKVVDTSIIPYVRSRLINFHAKALKPSTELIATFDGVEVTPYCYPATELKLTPSSVVNQNATSIVLTTNSTIRADIIFKRKDRIFVRETLGLFQNGNTFNWLVNGTVSGTAVIQNVVRRPFLTTNENGDIAGTFLIPNNDLLRFRTGEKLFKLSDELGVTATTAAATKYVAQGLSQSVERTLVSTQIATTSINPLLDVESTTKTSTSTTVVGTSTTTRDLTPPPPPPPPVPPTVVCEHNENGGKQGIFTYTVQFGSNTGICGITYDAFSSIPDRFTLIWDGNEYTTGFVGGTGYNSQLRSLGYPEVTGARSGILSFNKIKSQPTTAILRVDAPIKGTAWKYKVICPNGTPISPEPLTTPSIDLRLTVAASVSFGWAQRNLSALNSALRLIVETSGTSATFVRVSNLQVSVIDDRGAVVSGVTLNPSVRDIETSLNLKNGRRNGESSININVLRPSRNRSNYTVTVTGTAAVYNTSTDRTNGTNPVIVSSISTAKTIVTRDDNLGRPTDPVAQTFFVDANQFPNGIFLDSVDLYFRKKSLTLPVTLQIRPTVNGYPSSTEIVPFSVVNLLPEEVNISNDGSRATNFKFDAPIYLPPGEHSFVALCNTDEYEIFTAVLGDFLLTDNNIRITEQPAVGSMFKSQNSSTWTPVQEEDVKFKLNKCVFNTGTANAATITTYVNYPTKGNTVYDLLFADGEHLDFAATEIQYYYKTTNQEDNITDQEFTRYQLGSNVPMRSRQIVRTGSESDLQFNFLLSTVDRNVTPVIDLSRFSAVLVQNNINNAGLSTSNFLITDFGEGYTGNANVTITASSGSGAQAIAEYLPDGKFQIVVTNPGSGYTGEVTATIDDGGTATRNAQVIVQNEIGNFGGNAVARYITRKVTLAPNFESLDLKTYILANIPSGTQIKVYYKVAPITSIAFELEPWREMIIESSGSPSETGFVDYKYKTVTDTALPSGDRFKTFAIKIVMLSNNPVRVPQIKDLRVVALDD